MPVDTGFNWEAWTLPTVAAGAYTKKFDVSKAIESYNINVRYSGLSDGTGTIDRTFPRLGDLITRDKTNPANDKGSMLRLKKGSTYIRDFVFYRLNKEWDDKKPTHDFILQGPEFLLDKARVRRYDHPRLPSTNPDWEYGATTIINELGGEQVREIHTIWTNATSGTWEIVFQGQTTDPLTIPTTASDIRTAMQDLSNVEDVDVTGEGTSVTPWEITYVDPAGNVTLVTVNNSTDGAFTVNELQQGGTLDPRPWHRSYHPVTGILHGNYQQFAIDDGTSGSLFPGDSYALVVDSDSLATPTDYSGAQVIENVVPSTQYRAKIPVYCDGAPLTVRLVIRDMQENLIAASEDTVIPADTWTWIEAFPITGVRIPAGVTEVIYRVGIIESTNVVPLRIAVEQAIFAPGFDEDYIGAIFNDIIQQGVAFGDLDWVTPTWTDTLDSAGVAWDMKRQWKVNHNQTFLQLLERAIKWGYEFDLYYDDATTTWKWDMFNPGGGGQTITDLSLKGKDSVKGGGGSITFPGATWFDAEGDAGQWGQYEDLVLSAAWGRIQGAIADDQGLDGTGLADLAQTRVEDASDGSESTQITLRNPEKVPFVDFFPGDSFEFDNSPIGEKRVRRCQLISIEQSPGEPGPTYQVHGDAIVFGGESAMAENVRTLARKVDAIVVPRARERTWDPAMFNVGSETIGAGGTIPWVVAANNAPQDWKDVAGFLCDGTDDDVQIQACLDAYNYAFLSPGAFNADMTSGVGIDMPSGAVLIGSGMFNTFISDTSPSDPGAGARLIDTSGSNAIRDLNVDASTWDGSHAIRAAGFTYLESVQSSVWRGLEAAALRIVGDNVHAERCRFLANDTGSKANPSYGVLINQGSVDQTQLNECLISGGTYGISVDGNLSATGFNLQIEGCEFSSIGFDCILLDGSPSPGNAGYFGSITRCKFTSWGVNAGSADRAAAIKIIGDGVKRTSMNNSSTNFGIHEPPLISNCVMEQGSHWGIVIEDHAGLMISDLYMEDLDQAIVLDNSDECTIDNVRMHWCGSRASLLDLAPIRIENDSNYNMVRNIKILNAQGDTTVHPDHGIEITTADCDENVIVHNDLRNPGEAFVVSAILDSGTGTIFTMAGGTTSPGDNLV